MSLVSATGVLARRTGGLAPWTPAFLNPRVFAWANEKYVNTTGANVDSFKNLGTEGGTLTLTAGTAATFDANYYGAGLGAATGADGYYSMVLNLDNVPALTLVAIGRETFFNTTRYPIGWGSDVGAHSATHASQSDRRILAIHRTNGAGSSARFADRTWSGKACVVSTHVIAKSGTEEVAVWVNGSSRDAGVGGFNANATANFTGAGVIRLFNNYALSGAARGHFAAWCLFDRELTADEIALVSNWGREQLNILAGEEPGVLAPTGHWIGGTGITLNTTPDPDQISAWANQAGTTGSRNFTQATEGSQPFANEYAAGLFAPEFLVPRSLGTGLGLHNFVGDVAGTMFVVVKAGANGTFTAAGPGVIGTFPNYWSIAWSGSGAGALVRSALRKSNNVTEQTPSISATESMLTVVAVRHASPLLTLRVFDANGDRASSLALDLPMIYGALNAQQLATAGNTNADRWVGKVYEAAMFNTALTDDQITDIAAYLLALYQGAT